MTKHSAPRRRNQGLKTWSSLGNLGRRPTEYEILTHGMNHTLGATPLELGPDVHGNRWLRVHRDAMAVEVADWDAFRDPDATTYARYVAGQDDQETYVEGLLEQFDREGHDVALSPQALDFLAAALTPGRYLAHGLQMMSAYVQQLAPGSFIATAATFQTADQLRRVQLTAYRTTQLRRTHPDRAFGSGERAVWEEDRDWQPIRRAVEEALVEFYWDRALVATQLVVKPVTDILLLEQLRHELTAAGCTLDALIIQNLWRDAQRSQRWTTALATFIADAAPGNREVLQGHLDSWARHGHAMIASGAALLARAGGRRDTDIAAAALQSWGSILEPAALTIHESGEPA